MLEPSVESWLPQLLADKAFFEAMSRREVGLRAQLPHLPSLGTPTELLLLEEARSVISEAANLSELLLVTFVTCEVMLKHPTDARRRTECIKMLSRLNPADVMAANASFLDSVRPQAGSPEKKVTPGPEALRDLVSLAEAVTRGEGFDNAEFFAWVDLPEVQARISRAHESMKQFIVRNDPWLDSRLAVLGEKYAQGLLSVPEVAAVLQIGVPDAVVRLEECGYVRSLEATLLTSEKRAGLFAALRRDRIHRQGKPQPNQSGIFRSVAATQRIEGIDARGWLELK